jgi:OOP family OmpA-OmpF porin
VPALEPPVASRFADPPLPEAPQPAAPAPQPQSIALPSAVTFASGSDVLTLESDAVLHVVLDQLREHDDWTMLRIEGHTDSSGNGEANFDLSRRRAIAVANWLVARGVACGRLLPVGFGSSRPLGDNLTAEGRAQNRRTAFVTAEIGGRRTGDRADDGGITAGNACVTGVPGAEASAPAGATPTAPQAAPAPSASGYILVGTWTGTVTEGSLTYEMTVSFAGDHSGAIHYGEPFDCSGTWAFKDHVQAARSYSFQEKITEQKGKRKCAKSGGVHGVAEADGSLVHFSWGGGQAKWDMRRVK